MCLPNILWNEYSLSHAEHIEQEQEQEQEQGMYTECIAECCITLKKACDKISPPTTVWCNFDAAFENVELLVKSYKYLPESASGMCFTFSLVIDIITVEIL